MKRRSLGIKPRITKSGKIGQKQFAFCEMTVNGDKKIKAVTSLSDKDVILKAERKIKEGIRSVHVEILKVYDKI